jgi:hypothetical protein
VLNLSWPCVVVALSILFYFSFLTPSNALTDNLHTGQFIKTEDNYLTYQNATFSFKLDYPSTWTVAENNPDLALRVKDVVVNFFSPAETYSDIFSENLNVVVSKVDETEPMSIGDLTYMIIPSIKQVFGVHDSIEPQDLNLDGNPAKKINYSYNLFNKVLQNTQVYSIKSGNFYVITYVCDPLTCSSYVPTFEKMIHSFKFITP